MTGRRMAFAAALGGLLAGCAGGPAAGGDAAPRARIASIARPDAGENERRMWALIEELESNDPAVRLMAIATLERLTGTRRGYEPYDSFDDRQVAVDRWRHAMEQGQEAH